MAYAATFDVQRPTKEFDKAQIALRIVLLLFIGWVVNGLIGWFAYLGLPIIAAVMISQRGAQEYLANHEDGPTKWLRYVMGFYSYFALLSDDMPFDRPENVNFKIQPTGTPTVGSALLRIILVIPHAIVLGLLGIAFAVVWLIAVISILINGTYPDWAFNFIRGYLCWNARVFAYMASLVDEYPPFSFDDGGAPAPAAAAPPSAPTASEMPPEPPAESGGDAPPSQPAE